jgi:hypothetical protein
MRPCSLQGLQERARGTREVDRQNFLMDGVRCITG